jgi:hypothetical protein
MASHWPPENLPMREVELRTDGLHRRSGTASSQVWGTPSAHSESTPACCLYLRSNPIAKSRRHFPRQISFSGGLKSKKTETAGQALRILGGSAIAGPWIDPYRAGSYNLICSGSSLVLLPICWYGSRVDRGLWWACFFDERVDQGCAGTAEKARDGAPKAG